MPPIAVERRIQNLLLLCAFGVTLVVTPWFNLDPINLPKFLILSVCAFVAMGCVIPYIKKLSYSRDRRITLIFVLSFFVAMTSSFLFSGSGRWAQFYGVFGRNTGLLAYISLVLIFFCATVIASSVFVDKLIWVLIATGIFNSVYGFFQWMGMDPIDWNNPFNPILGTLGNPNFVSAHLGIVAVASFAVVLHKSTKLLTKCVLVVQCVFSSFLMFQSNSSQGLLIFIAGAAFVLYLSIFRHQQALVHFAYVGLSLAASILGVLGILNKGPLAPFLFQPSVTYRGDYWRAGWNMTLERPLFGVGLDSYGDWFRFSRTEMAALRRGPDVTSNSAHNVFLDMSSSGGFPLLLAYAALLTLVAFSAIRLMRKSYEENSKTIALVAAWFAYVIQSVISINQLGLAIWGWILGGTIIGYSLRLNRKESATGRVSSVNLVKRVPASVVMTSSIGALVGVLVSIWPFVSDVSFRNALAVGDPRKIQNATMIFPQNTRYLVTSAEVFLENSLYDESLDMAKRITELNPLEFNGWRFIAANPNASPQDKLYAIEKMKELDPFNNTLDK